MAEGLSETFGLHFARGIGWGFEVDRREKEIEFGFHVWRTLENKWEGICIIDRDWFPLMYAVRIHWQLAYSCAGTRDSIPHHVLKFISLIHRGISKTTPRILCCMNGNYMHKIPSKTLSSEDHSGWGWEEGDPILLTFKSSLNQRHLIPCHKSFDIYIHIRLARGYPICQRNVKRHHKNSEDNIYKHIYIYNWISIYIYIYIWMYQKCMQQLLLPSYNSHGKQASKHACMHH